MLSKNSRFSYIERIFIGLSVLLYLVYLWQNKILLYDFVSSVSFVCLWIQGQFSLIGDFESDWFVWVPFILVIGCTIMGMMLYPKPPWPLRFVAVLALILSHTLYIVFRTFNTLRFNTIGSGVVTVSLWISETIIYLCSLSLYIQLMFTTDRRSMADTYSKAVISGKYQPLVDVFIPTHSEPIEMIRRTVIGCQAIEYSNKRVYILDDGNRSEIKELACKLNCLYISRTKNIHAKAGNINNALSQTNGELVAMFDADCIPLRNFLTRTVGFFQEQEVGLVNTAQSFYNADMFKHNAMSLMEQSDFFRSTQSGRDRFNALLCFGTCFVVRRSAMEKIGGIPIETLSEDWATSIKLQAAGYKTYALDETLGNGTVAESMGEYLQQRIRWTHGTLQSLFASTNPLRIKGLSLMQRLIHTYTILHYLINPFYVFIIVVPLLYFFFGFSPFYVSRGQFWFFFAPFMCLSALIMSWVCREYTSKLSALIAESFISVPLSIATVEILIRPFGRRFRVTRKGIYRTTTSINWFIGTPLLIFFSFLIIGVIYGYRVRHWYGSEELFWFLFYCSVARIIFIWIGIYASYDFSQQRTAMRFQHKLNCSFFDGQQVKGTTVNVSEVGVVLRCDKNLDAAQIDIPATISIEAIGLVQAPVRLKRVDNGCYAAMAFENMSLEACRRLIEFLYCRPRQEEQRNILDKKVLRAVVKALTFDGIFGRRASSAAVK